VAAFPFPTFRATFVEAATGAARTEEVSQLLAVRISNFGGLVQNLAPGAEINNNRLRAILIKTQSRSRYMPFMAAVWLRRHTFGGPIELVKTSRIECDDLSGSPTRTYVEADGELLGSVPVRLEVVQDALTLLVPPRMLAQIAES